MKTMKLLLPVVAFLAGGLLQAQVSVSVNIGNPPAWGPAGYSEVRYYYLPDIDTYYDLGTQQYIYVNKGRWVRTASLPVAYRSYDLYNGYKVVLADYSGTRPYVYYKTHRKKYPHGYRPVAVQRTIGLPPGHAKKAILIEKPGRDVVIVDKKPKKHKHGHGHGKKHKH
jgi:hypothetical protein